MADKAETQEAKPKSKGAKTMMLVAALLVLEGAGIFGVMKFMGGPSPVQGEQLDLEAEAEQNRLVEVMVIREKLPNQSTGRIWLYDTEIYISVRARHQEEVEKLLTERAAEIRTSIRSIWARAHHEDFKEPQLQRLTTQAHDYLMQLVDGGQVEDPRIAKVLIARCNGFRADF
jgi:flagellar basal body-associated protein FliL